MSGDIRMTANQDATSDARRLTFALCVESGPLEEGTIRFVESLRRFGGPLAMAKVVAVTPRPGPPLKQSTLKRFAKLDVDYVRVKKSHPYDWMAYLGKYFAITEAEKRATGDLIVWMDSDVIVLRPPTDLLLADGVQFAACPRDRNIGVADDTGGNRAYWSKVAQDAGLSIQDLPWVTTTADNENIRLYWNAGIFVYRHGSNFADPWMSTMRQVLDRTDATSHELLFWTDQVCLSFVAIQQGLRFEHLGGHMNYGIATHFKDHLSPEGVRSASLLHYHDAMRPENWDWTLRELAEAPTEVIEWLRSIGPSQDPRTRRDRLHGDLWRMRRQIKRRLWSRTHGGGPFGS
jgi:hypothetical protein